MVSLFGFIYNISSFYTISSFKGMAAHTAISFTMVFFSVLLIFPDFGFMRIFVSRGLSGLAARRLLFVLVCMIAAEVLATIGRRINIFDYSFELLIHLSREGHVSWSAGLTVIMNDGVGKTFGPSRSA